MRKVIYWLTPVFSVLLIVAGVWALFDPAATLVSFAWFIGLVMMVCGVCEIAAFACEHNIVPGAGWLLADGILTVLMSIFVLFNNMLTAAALPYMFGMWAIISGIQRTVMSFDLKSARVRGWGWMTALGILTALLGVVAFIEPVVGAAALTVMVYWFLISYGVTSLVVWSRVNSARRFALDVRDSLVK